MWGEKTTLRAFGGGVDPEEVDEEEDEAVRDRQELVVTGRDRTITDLGVPLKRDLVERLDSKLLAEGAEQRQLRLQPQEAAWAEGLYLKAVPTETNRKFEHKVGGPESSPRVGLPRALLRNERVKGVLNPFHNATNADEVILWYRPDGIEIYPLEVYKAHRRWGWIRTVAPVVVGDSVGVTGLAGDDRVDIAADTSYAGQVFELVPFDWQVFSRYYWEMFVDQGLVSRVSRRLSGYPLLSVRRGKTRVLPEEFRQVLAEGGVRPCTSASVQIMWKDGDAVMYKYGKFLEDTGPCRLVVPRDGDLFISPKELVLSTSSAGVVELRYDSASLSFNMEFRDDFARINEEWWGQLFEVPAAGPPIIYVPVISESDTMFSNRFESRDICR